MYRIVGDKNVIYSAASVALDKGYGGEVFKYGMMDGWLVFEVAEGEQNLAMIYSGSGTKARYIAVPAE